MASSSGEILQSLSDSYELLEPLGSGGFGATFRARRRSTGDLVVVKRIDMERAGDWKAVEIFEREATQLRSIKHPAVARYVDYFILGDVSTPSGFVLVQSYVPGGTHDVLLETRGPLELSALVQLFWTLLEGLSYLHSLNPPVVHHDIVPRNIVQAEQGPVLVDLGNVRVALGAPATDTESYVAPELLQGQSSPANDLYGLALTTLVLASGTPPDALPRHEGSIALREAAPSELDAELVDVLEAMLSPDPAERPTSARAILRRLEPVRQKLGITTDVSRRGHRRRASVRANALAADLFEMPSAPAAPSSEETAISGVFSKLSDADLASAPEEDATLAVDINKLMVLSYALEGQAQDGTLQDEGELDLGNAPFVLQWRHARERLTRIPAGSAWPAPPLLPLTDLRAAVFNTAGTRMFLGLERSAWVFDMATVAVYPLPAACQPRGSRDTWNAAFSPDGHKLAILDTSASRLTLVDFDTPEGVPVARSEPFNYGSGSVSVAICPDNASVAIGLSNDELLIIGWEQGEVIERVYGRPTSAGLTFVTPRTLLCRGEGAANVVFELGGDERRLAGLRVAVVPNARTAVRVDAERPNRIVFINLENHEPMQNRPVLEVEGRIELMRFSPDGMLLAVAVSRNQGWEVQLLNTHSGDRIAILEDPYQSTRFSLGAVYGLGFDAGGERISIFAEAYASSRRPRRRKSVLVYELGAVPRFLAQLLGLDRSRSTLERELASTLRTQLEASPGDYDALIIGRCDAGFFGRLDADASIGASGAIAPFERPRLVRTLLYRGFVQTQLEEVERACLDDLLERYHFWRDAQSRGRAKRDEYVDTFVDLTRGWTHLLPEIVHRARELMRASPRYGPRSSPPVAAAPVDDAVQELARLGFEEYEEVFEAMIARLVMLERQRLEMEADHVRLQIAEAKRKREARERARQEEERMARERVQLETELAAKQQVEQLEQAKEKKLSAVQQALAEVGLDEASYPALILFPLLQVAWADGKLQEEEIQSIVEQGQALVAQEQYARFRSVFEALPEYLERERPDALTFTRARHLLIALAMRHRFFNLEQADLDLVLPLCRAVASAAGGFLGVGKISKEEKQVLHEIERDLDNRQAISDAFPW